MSAILSLKFFYHVRKDNKITRPVSRCDLWKRLHYRMARLWKVKQCGLKGGSANGFHTQVTWLYRAQLSQSSGAFPANSPPDIPSSGNDTDKVGREAQCVDWKGRKLGVCRPQGWNAHTQTHPDKVRNALFI